jgi:hypothetical protein
MKIDRTRVVLVVVGAWSGMMLAGTATARAQEASRWADRRFEPSREAFANPARGFYSPRMSHRMNSLEGVRRQNMSLLLVELDLRDFKEREISAEKLDELRRAFAQARQNGLKVIFRAAYGFTGRDYRADPKDMGRILGHIRQLGAVFTEGRDVLYGIQAGFLGPWGEWHGSNWGDPPSLEARRAVLFGLLEAAPSPITVSIRRPMFVRDIFAREPGGSTLTPETAHSGSRLSRTGWHDDALLSLPTDMGTFAERGWDRERELAWCDNHGRYTPFGGESVPPSAKTPIDQVVRELERFHATYLNIAYHGGTLNGWRKAEYRGENAFAHIERRLGYRFEPAKLRYTSTVEPGGTLEFALELRNVGFSSPHFPVEVAAVLARADRAHRVVLADADPRRWDPESGVITVRGKLTVPADLPRGSWRLALHLADPSPKLRDDARYAIRLAGREVVFDEKSGRNVLVDDVTIR